MAYAQTAFLAGQAWVVGSFGDVAALREATAGGIAQRCDVAEIRLDVMLAQGVEPTRALWQQLAGVPLLFTARRSDEGGALGLDAAQRSSLLAAALDDAAYIDVELASHETMGDILAEASRRGIPWIASFHDFKKLPTTAVLVEAAQQARAAGAAVFKVAAQLNTLADVLRLAEFQLSPQGLPLATMGMGAWAPASRLLCAQCGSALNYGYLGSTPTAPGQWDCGLLKQAISQSLPPAQLGSLPL
ncbi:MAG: type I 3-dehydroquinate dehydratase [Verrucomicrobia bacterium]|nr:MAG: type I 3-dehydroquinate dehydratase [Verrucomicrobiota bacterium]